MMKTNQPYYGVKKKQIQTGYEKYTPTMVGKIAMAITVPSALIAFISVMVALIAIPDALIVTLFTFVISFVGSIVIAGDIIIFNHKQKKKTADNSEPKTLDIMRIVHMLIGILVGIIIGYLIWGIEYK